MRWICNFFDVDLFLVEEKEQEECWSDDKSSEKVFFDSVGELVFFVVEQAKIQSRFWFDRFTVYWNTIMSWPCQNRKLSLVFGKL